MSAFPEHTMTLTQSQRHWKAWLTALQTRDANLRAVALEQLSKFLDYWTAELYVPLPVRGLVNGRSGQHDSPASWDEVFDVDAELLVREKRPVRTKRTDSDEAWVGPYGLDEVTFDSNPLEMEKNSLNPWDNDDGSKETRETLSRYFCGIQRLSIDCPFADVRRTCRKLLDKAKLRKVEIPSLVHDSPSWLIPLSDIIGFKSSPKDDPIAISIPEKYVSDPNESDASSHEESDVELNLVLEPSTEGYSYYDSPETTPRPVFSTPAIPINVPPRSRKPPPPRDFSRQTSTDSLVSTMSHKGSSGTALTINAWGRHKWPKQPKPSKEIREFQIESWIKHGRVTNYAKLLFGMPRYVRCSSTCHEKLLGSSKNGSAMTRSVKMYFALMAAAERGCQYFVSYFTAKFLEVGGNGSWLKGLDGSPEKVQLVAELNRKIAMGGWELTAGDLRKLIGKVDGKVKNGSSPSKEESHDKWSITELVHIIVILAMFHAQSSIALGLGVVSEGDVFGGTIWRKISRFQIEDDTSETEHYVSVGGERMKEQTWEPKLSRRDEIVEKLRLRTFGSGHLSPDLSFENLVALRRRSFHRSASEEDPNEVIFRQLLEPHSSTAPPQKDVSQAPLSDTLAQSLPAKLHLAKHLNIQSPSETPINPIIEDLSRFTISSISTSSRFPKSTPILSTKTFFWDDAFQTLSVYLPDLAPNLDKRFHLPPTRTFLQPDQSDSPVDITPFTHALQNYTLAQLGIYKEDYSYKEIHEWLDNHLLQWVDKLSLDAKSVTKTDWETMRTMGFSASELSEICVIVCEARFLGVLVRCLKVLEGLVREGI